MSFAWTRPEARHRRGRSVARWPAARYGARMDSILVGVEIRQSIDAVAFGWLARCQPTSRRPFTARSGWGSRLTASGIEIARRSGLLTAEVMARFPWFQPRDIRRRFKASSTGRREKIREDWLDSRSQQGNRESSGLGSENPAGRFSYAGRCCELVALAGFSAPGDCVGNSPAILL